MAQFTKSVTIRLRYRNEEIIIPVNPESITVNRASPSKSERIIGLGEIAIPQTPELATVQIKSAFYRYLFEESPIRYAYRTAKEYADWFKTWQRMAVPAQWTVEELGYNLQVICEEFNYEVRAGEEDDTYYELSLKEYRPYGSKTLKINSAEGANTASESQIAEPTAPTRVDSSPPVGNVYTVVQGDSLWSITHRLTGDGGRWRELYEINKSVIGDNYDIIHAGQSFSIPQNWVNTG